MPAVGPRRKSFIESPMKRLGLSPLILSATLFLAASPAAQPQDEPRQSPKGEGGSLAMKSNRAEELLKSFDRNGDGKLDDDEEAAAHEAMLKEQMDRQAVQAAAPKSGQFRQKMLEMFDKNHDGRLDDDERAAMQKYIQAQGLGPGGMLTPCL
jgi:Ca2+-binding EF-hand superfamily protein